MLGPFLLFPVLVSAAVAGELPAPVGDYTGSVLETWEPDESGDWVETSRVTEAWVERQGVRALAVEGLQLADTDRIITERARVRLRAGVGEITVYEDTSVVIEEWGLTHELGALFVEVSDIFRVSWGSADAIVEGTAFQVEAEGETFAVLVSRGRVRVRNEAGEVLVEPGRVGEAVAGLLPTLRDQTEAERSALELGSGRAWRLDDAAPGQRERDRGSEGAGDEGAGDEGAGDEGAGDEGAGDEGAGDEGAGAEGAEGAGDEGEGADGAGSVEDGGVEDEGAGDGGADGADSGGAEDGAVGGGGAADDGGRAGEGSAGEGAAGARAQSSGIGLALGYGFGAQVEPSYAGARLRLDLVGRQALGQRLALRYSAGVVSGVSTSQLPLAVGLTWAAAGVDLGGELSAALGYKEGPEGTPSTWMVRPGASLVAGRWFPVAERAAVITELRMGYSSGLLITASAGGGVRW